jgi:hypothetical protein
MSYLPGVANAIVSDVKITDYLLNPSHSVAAAGKANFFAAFGFSASNWQELKRALLQHPRSHEVSGVMTTPYGEKYEVSCSLATPDGRNPCVISIWIVERPDPDPRFVTAYPGLP